MFSSLIQHLAPALASPVAPVTAPLGTVTAASASVHLSLPPNYLCTGAPMFPETILDMGVAAGM